MDVEELMRRYIQTGRNNNKLKEQIFYESLNFVPYVLNKMGISTKDEDLMQEGQRILWELIDCYDPNRNTKFSTYAITYLFFNLKKVIRKSKWFVHTPTYISDILTSTKSDDIINKSPEELAEEHNIPLKVAKNVQLAAKRNSISGEEEEYDWTIFNSEDSLLWELALSKLTKEEYIIFQLTADGYKQKEIAEQIGCTQAQVSKILKSAYNKLRKELS